MFHSFHFTIIFKWYSVDHKLSEKHNFISIAVTGWSVHKFWTNAEAKQHG